MVHYFVEPKNIYPVLAIKKYFSCFIVVLVALQVLNLGLYAQDFTPLGRDAYGYKPNIINSVTEYIAEIVMQKRNAFPERRESSNQSEHEAMYKFQPFKIYASSQQYTVPVVIAEKQHYNRFLVKSYINHTSDIMSPPPKSLSRFAC